MGKLIFLPLVGFLSVFMLFGCRSERVVHAGNEPGPSDYQPRQGQLAGRQDSPNGESTKTVDHQLSGELINVDVANNTIIVRAENGMEQTFKLDNTTAVNGAAGVTIKRKSSVAANNKSNVKSLAGKKGEIVVVEFEDPSGPKLATSIVVK